MSQSRLSCQQKQLTGSVYGEGIVASPRDSLNSSINDRQSSDFNISSCQEKNPNLSASEEDYNQRASSQSFELSSFLPPAAAADRSTTHPSSSTTATPIQFYTVQTKPNIKIKTTSQSSLKPQKKGDEIITRRSTMTVKSKLSSSSSSQSSVIPSTKVKKPHLEESKSSKVLAKATIALPAVTVAKTSQKKPLKQPPFHEETHANITAATTSSATPLQKKDQRVATFFNQSQTKSFSHLNESSITSPLKSEQPISNSSNVINPLLLVSGLDDDSEQHLQPIRHSSENSPDIKNKSPYSNNPFYQQLEEEIADAAAATVVTPRDAFLLSDSANSNTFQDMMHIGIFQQRKQLSELSPSSLSSPSSDHSEEFMKYVDKEALRRESEDLLVGVEDINAVPESHSIEQSSECVAASTYVYSTTSFEISMGEEVEDDDNYSDYGHYIDSNYYDNEGEHPSEHDQQEELLADDEYQLQVTPMEDETVFSSSLNSKLFSFNANSQQTKLSSLKKSGTSPSSLPGLRKKLSQGNLHQNSAGLSSKMGGATTPVKRKKATALEIHCKDEETMRGFRIEHTTSQHSLTPSNLNSLTCSSTPTPSRLRGGTSRMGQVMEGQQQISGQDVCVVLDTLHRILAEKDEVIAMLKMKNKEMKVKMKQLDSNGKHQSTISPSEQAIGASKRLQETNKLLIEKIREQDKQKKRQSELIEAKNTYLKTYKQKYSELKKESKLRSKKNQELQRENDFMRSILVPDSNKKQGVGGIGVVPNNNSSSQTVVTPEMQQMCNVTPHKLQQQQRVMKKKIN